MKSFLSLIILLPVLAFAAPELRSKKALKTTLKANSFSATVESGYHFNEKAPNGIQIGTQFIKPTQFSARQLEVSKLPKDLKDAVANLYVCDDKVTFCEVHMIPLGQSANSTPPEPTKKKNGTAIQTDKNGFYNNFESGLKLAKRLKQNVFVDFGARWCPACLRLESEIFQTPEFKQLTQDFVKIKVDVDEFQNSPLLQKYNVKAYPTTLFLSPDGEEIIRFLDYQPLPIIKSVIAEVKSNPHSITDLEKQEKTADIQNQLWPRYFHSSQYDKALAILEKIDPKPKEYLTAQIEQARIQKKENPALKDQYIKVLRSALKSEPDSTRSLYWRSVLIEELSENHKDRKALALESQKLTDKWLQDPNELKKALATDSVGEYTGLEGFYVAFMNAEVADSAGLNPKSAWEKVVEQAKIYKITSQQAGPSLRVLTAMMQAEQYEDSLKLVQEMLKQDPTNGDLQRRELRVLLELKKYTEAIAVGEKALKNSYGINEFFVVEPLAKAYMGLNQKEKAKSLVNKYLSKNEINFPDMQRLKKSLESLDSKLLI